MQCLSRWHVENIHPTAIQTNIHPHKMRRRVLPPRTQPLSRLGSKHRDRSRHNSIRIRSLIQHCNAPLLPRNIRQIHLPLQHLHPPNPPILRILSLLSRHHNPLHILPLRTPLHPLQTRPPASPRLHPLSSRRLGFPLRKLRPGSPPARPRLQTRRLDTTRPLRGGDYGR